MRVWKLNIIIVINMGQVFIMKAKCIMLVLEILAVVLVVVAAVVHVLLFPQKIINYIFKKRF